MLPVIVAGWLLGAWAGLFAGVFGFLLDVLLLTLHGESGWAVMAQGMPGSLLLVPVGAVVGRLRDLGERAQVALTERVRAEEQVRQQNAVSSAINAVLLETLACESDEAVASACLAVAEALTGSTFGFVGEVNPKGRLDTIALSDPGWDACGVPETNAVAAIHDMEIRGIWGSVIRDGQPLITNDPPSHPDSVGMPEGHPPVTAFLGVPLKRLGTTVGMIGLANKEAGYDVADQQAVEALSVAFMEALNRVRMEEDLRENEARYRSMVAALTEGIVLQDADGTVRTCNASAERILGLSVDQMMGRAPVDPRWRSIHEDGSPFPVERYPPFESLRTGKPYADVIAGVHKPEGTTTWVSVNSQPMFRPGESKPYAVVTSFTDLTERVRGEEERESLLAAERDQRLLAETLRRVAVAVNSSLDRGEVLSLILTHLAALVAYDSAVVMLRSGGKLGVVAYWSVDREREARVPEQIAALPHVREVVVDHRPVIIPDTLADERWVHVPGSEYIRCWLGVPLIVQERAIGLLGLNHHQAGFYTKEHARLALSVASHAASAIENARLFEETRRRAAQQEALNAIIAASVAAPDLTTLLEVALDRVLETLELAMGVVWVPGQQVARGLGCELQEVIGQIDRVAAQGIPDTEAVEDWQMVSADDPLSVIASVMSRCGIRASLTVPLLAEGQRIGGLSLATPKPRTWSPDEVMLTEAVGRQLGVRAERLRLLTQIREQARLVRQIVDTVPEGVLLLDDEMNVRLANPLALQYLRALSDGGMDEALTQLGERPLVELLSPPAVGMWHSVVVEGPPAQAFEVAAEAVGDKSPEPGWVLVLRDVTQERQVEEQARQQDRLAAIGQLAGGVAHDFNNVLTAIQGHSQIMLNALASDDPQDWPPGPQLRADLRDVVRAAERAAGLTRQLLAFSRRQILQPQVLDLNSVIADFEKMLRRLIGEDVELVTVLAPELGRVEADPGQVEQVIMNLAVNARDAMPNGGRLTLETAGVELDEAYAREHVEVEPGAYVMLAVSDTGVGMSEEVKARIFEPFFTTKEKGKGTGLGLSVVYGIVKQSGGDISFSSEPGMGTTFTVYLPRLEREAEAAVQVQAARPPARGTETILVAEDDVMVRTLACRALREYGYTVLEAAGPEDALRLASEHPQRIHLLLTDLVMPGMNGRELAERLLPSRPEMAVLYTSGYTGDGTVHNGVLDPDLPFLRKPFTVVTLARRVHDVLDTADLGTALEGTPAHLDAQDLDEGDATVGRQAIESVEPVSLTRASLIGLSEGLVAEMREATINADLDRLYVLIDRVETHDARVAAALRELAGRYEYDVLVGLFETGRREPSE
jgi:PAS domain S-box-containing protein